MTTRARILVAVAATSCLALAACSSSGSSSANSATATSSASTSSVTAGVAEAKQLVAQLTKAPTSIGVTQPVGKPIPKGKTIAFMACGVPTCTTFANITKQAAQSLGWTLNIINAGTTPQQVQAAWQQMARTKPDGVIGIGYPRSIFNSTLTQLQQEHIPVVEQGVTDPATNGILYVTGTPQDEAPTGQAMADWVVSDTDGKANALFVGDNDYPIVGSIQQAFHAQLNKLCATCTTSTYDAQTADIGTTLPSELTAYLRAHPQINYLVLGIDAMATGLPAALASAGLSGKVKFIGQTGDPLNKQYVAQGTQAADVPFATYEAMYRLIDVLARHFAGTTAGMQPTPLPVTIYTKNNVGNTKDYEPLVPDFQQQYYHLWGITG